MSQGFIDHSPDLKVIDEKNQKRLYVAKFPKIQRDLFLTRSIRKTDIPTESTTHLVEWQDMNVVFQNSANTTSCVVAVDSDIDLSAFANRLDMLLNCGVNYTATELSSGAHLGKWILKWAVHLNSSNIISVRKVLFDRTHSITTQEVVGLMKLRRRSIDAGSAKIRYFPANHRFEFVIEAMAPQSVRAVWKSLYLRMQKLL